MNSELFTPYPIYFALMFTNNSLLWVNLQVNEVGRGHVKRKKKKLLEKKKMWPCRIICLASEASALRCSPLFNWFK